MQRQLNLRVHNLTKSECLAQNLIIHCVPKTRDYVFDDKLNYTVFQKKTCDHIFDDKLN